MQLPTHPLIAVMIGAALIVSAAWMRRSLTTAGAIAAWIMGVGVTASAGWVAAGLLILFFVSSSAMPALTTHAIRHSERRTAAQVLANGGVGLIASLLYAATDSPTWLFALAASYAAANADTWSTEIGRTSPTQPRMIITLRAVPAGTSGAVSLRGTLGSIAGALVLTVAAWLGDAAGGWNLGRSGGMIVLGIGLAGILGGLADSIIGATVQERRLCPTCNEQTEVLVHHCGTTTVRTGGLARLDNNAVNLACTTIGAAAGIFMHQMA